MIYADINIAKLNHFTSVISSDGEVLVELFKFSNVFEGFRSLSLVLDKYNQEQLLVSFESTVHYSNNLIEFLVTKDAGSVSSILSILQQCRRSISATRRR